MRNLIAILILTAIAAPLKAQNLSADVTVNALIRNHDGNQGMVLEYDGRKTDSFNAGSVDFNATANGEKTYLGLSAYGIGSGEGSTYLNLNVGTLGIKASENTLVHRQPWINTGMMVNGVWTGNTNEKPTDNRWNNGVNNTADVMSESFKRAESDINVSYTCPKTGDYSVHAGLWEENEKGDAATKSSGKVMQTYVDRSLKMLNLGLDAKLGDGAMAYDYTKGGFSDDAAMVMLSTTSSFYWQKAPAPNHNMDMHSLAFRSQPMKGYSVTGSVRSRTRESLSNGYTTGSYTATLAASHRFGKKLNVTVKGYGHTRQVTENDSFEFMNKVTNGVPSSTKPGEYSHVDRANFTGEMLARYAASEKIDFSLGYKLDHNYRRHAGTELFTSSQTYVDGGYVEKNTQWNAIDDKNTQSIYSAGANVSLPLSAELGLGYKALRANRAVFESQPTTSDEYSAELYIPVKGSLSFTGSAMLINGKNEESYHTNSKDDQFSYLAGLGWFNDKYTAGANYAYDRMSSHSDAYYAGYSPWYQDRDVPGSRPERTLGALYRYTNDTLGFNGSVKLSDQYTLAANSSYTRSVAVAPVNVVTTNGTITDTEPSDIRIVSNGLNMKYSPANNKSLSADLGLRRNQWTDKHDSINSGWVNSASLMVSAKF